MATRLLTFLLAVAGASTAQAEWRPTALLRFATSYVYHGYDKSDGHPVTQAHAGVVDDRGVYGGLWLTQLDFGGAQLEAIPYVGAQRQLAPDLRLDAVLSGYIYDANVFGRNADYSEVSLALDWRRLLGARVAAAFDSYGGAATTPSAELTARYPLTDVCDLVASAGFDNLARATSYDVGWWSAGARYFIGRYLVAELRYLDQRYVNEIHLPQGESRFAAAEIGPRAQFSLSVGF
ncbi:MAG: hypothetical protein K2Y51_07505 [Gammaproteobacteria bacterium]|nr:hypothetical protein [Gammaproteobacteria bacterium]